MNEIEVIHTTDREGRPIVLVPLSNSEKPAVVDEKVFYRLLAMGVPVRWRLYKGRVQVWNQERDIAIARLIVNAGPEEKVVYRNRNKFDLTTPNLIIDNVRSSATEHKWDRRVRRSRKAKLAHKFVPSNITLQTFGL